MPICLYQTKKSRTCRGKKGERPLSEFLSYTRKKIKIAQTCQACREYYQKKPKQTWVILKLVPPSELSPRTRQLFLDVTRTKK